jgi:uncharacterized membrane protein YphA (DoxX/SURF4 family)
MTIELPEDFAQPARVTVGQTLLRLTLGGLLIAHGVQRLLGFDAWQDELAVQFALLEPDTIARVWIGIELFAGVGLTFGWFSRLSALAALCSAVLSIVLEVVRQGDALRIETLEVPALLGICSIYFVLARGGIVSLDHWLHARRRRKAIENDDMWLKHPYVPLPEEPSYEQSYERNVGDEFPGEYEAGRSYEDTPDDGEPYNPRLASTNRR